ncbi:putative ribonuclease H-like domain-containing protein, partial [Tanacetum coccineum]
TSKVDAHEQHTKEGTSKASNDCRQDNQVTRNDFEKDTAVDENVVIGCSHDPNIPELEDSGIFDGAYDDEDFVVEGDMNNLKATMTKSLIATTKVHKDHPVEQIIGDLHSAPQTRGMTRFNEEHDLPRGKWAIGTKWVFRNKKDERGIVVKNKARLVAQGHTQEEGIDYDEVFAPVARIDAIRLFLAYASYKDFVVHQMDVKSAFLYGKIEEEVYVCQPPGFEDPDFPDKVYKVEKALYGLHQAPRAWYETLSTYLLDHGFHRGQIDKTMFIQRHKDDILLVQVYVDDIIFGSTKKELSIQFEQLMQDKFQMSSMGELSFFLGLQVQQKSTGIFISQDKYVAEILKKFDFATVKTASTPIETNKALIKDEEVEDVDVHLYRSMIGSLMYLTASRPDIMFAVCACARIEAIRLFFAYASFMGFIVYQMDVKSAFLYEKALYGLHQAPRAWYETLSTYLLENGFRRGTIDKTLFIKKDRGDILLVQVYVDDIIFGSTKKSLCDEFEQIMHKRFQMSSMASTPIETNKALIKDEEAEDVDVHLYRSMIGSLMYLTASRPDIMFAVCACARFQVTPKISHLHAVKRIFRYLKGQPKLGLWYPRDSPFDLEAFSDSDYAGASLDRKSTTGGCQFLGKRLISWQCKKQTIVANSTTEAEYVAAANCCGQGSDIIKEALEWSSRSAKYENRLIPGDFETNAEENGDWQSKSFSGKVTPLFESMLVQNQVHEGENSVTPPEPQPTPSTSQPNVSEPQTELLQTETPPTVSHEPQNENNIEQILPSPSTYQRKHKKTQKHRRAKKVTELPQTCVPLDLGADEAAHKEGVTMWKGLSLLMLA